jgi:carbamoyl-phosphate synthase large subunit
VSTDYDTSDRLYFEPLTLEDVLEIVHVEKPFGVIVQYGARRRSSSRRDLAANGVPIIGTSPDMIDMAEDRERFQQMLHSLESQSAAESHRGARRAGGDRRGRRDRLPAVVRPSYVLGRSLRWKVVHDRRDLERYMREAVKVSERLAGVASTGSSNDASRSTSTRSCDGKDVVIGGIMEHIEQAGVHSGDSACSLPPYSLSEATQAELRRQRRRWRTGCPSSAYERAVRDPGRRIYVLRSQSARLAHRAVRLQSHRAPAGEDRGARCMVGQSLAAQGIAGEIVPPYFSREGSRLSVHQVPRRRYDPRP